MLTKTNIYWTFSFLHTFICVAAQTTWKWYAKCRLCPHGKISADAHGVRWCNDVPLGVAKNQTI